jgi:hypothetical protein
LDNYAQLDIDEVEQQQAKEDATAWMDADLSDFSDSDDIPSRDEYSRWCNEGRVSELHPLNFWNSPQQRARFPRLCQMARDLFTIPAMSDGPERVFSSAGGMVTKHRGRLTADAIAETQCLKSWIKQGIITNLSTAFDRLPPAATTHQ